MTNTILNDPRMLIYVIPSVCEVYTRFGCSDTVPREMTTDSLTVCTSKHLPFTLAKSHWIWATLWQVALQSSVTYVCVRHMSGSAQSPGHKEGRGIVAF